MMQPYVSKSVVRIKQSLKQQKELQNKKDDPAADLKDDVKFAVDLGVKKFVENLTRGKVDITNVSDFERLVKLGLLAHGEPTEIIENQENSQTIEEQHIEIVRGTAEFEAIKDMLAKQMNEKNQNNG
ncbi:hypothetical protein D3C74_50330 [compost metagenome]